MNRILITAVILSVVALAIGCSSSDNVNIDSVSIPTSGADYGEVILKWKNPLGEDLYYVDVEFTDSKGVKRSEKVSHFNADEDNMVEVVIAGFADTKEYEFTLTAYTKSGRASDPIKIKGIPLEPAFNKLLETVTLENKIAAITVNWDYNLKNKPLRLIVSYRDKEGKIAKSVYDVSDESTTVTKFIQDVPVGASVFQVIVEDMYQNSSESKEFDMNPLVETKISNTKWSIHGFSTQELRETAPNGRATAVIDGDAETWWKSQWAPAQVPYPHYIDVDLGENIVISGYEALRWHINNISHISHEFFTSVDGINWLSHGKESFNNNSVEFQKYAVITNPVARYFRFEMLESVGNANVATLAELGIYGAKAN